MPLIIVESPTKARTIQGILGNKYDVISSFGHVRDLPKSELAIDVEHNFKPRYIIPVKARSKVKALKEKVKGQKEIYPATDEDREGEAIAFHIKNVLSEDKKLNIEDRKYLRIAFHEITPEAIMDALAHPREIDKDLVEAQKTRRVLDRLVGYKLSPLLWKKIVRGISAGRVQSVALRLIVEREAERNKFLKEEYWTIEASFDIQSPKPKIQNAILKTILEEIDGKKLDKLAIKSKDDAEKIKAEIEKTVFGIQDIVKKPWKKSPEAPFITSTLQQTAGARFGYGAGMTMSIAQKLYETGRITYMRTGSTIMAQSALAGAHAFIQKELGSQYLAPRQWSTKVKLAQEAHEAIRPTNFTFTPAKAKEVLDARQVKLYTLIWQRALASQMREAIFEKTKITIDGQNEKTKMLYTLGSNGSLLIFDGFTKIYPVKLQDVLLPDIAKTDALILKEVLPTQHFTQPLPRFSEATLIKTLKDLGIGRPSTYAPTVDVIQKRRYVQKDEQKKLFPSDLGNAVSSLLTRHFPQIVDYNFTARMEDKLDDVANGKESGAQMLAEFYFPFAKLLEEKQNELKKEAFAQQEKTDRICPDCSSPVIKRLGRFGQFYSCSRFPNCKWAEAIVEKIGMKCPTCKDGDIIEKRTKKGRLFFGCSRYPACAFASWKKPTQEKLFA